MAGYFGTGNYFGGNAGGWGNPYTPSAIPAQTASSIMCVIIQNENEVANYLVAAGTTVMLVCFNTSRFFLKGMDRNGIQMPIRAFSFKEEQQVAKTEEPQTTAPAQSPQVAATKDDIERIEKQLAAITAAMGGGQNVAS